MRGRDQAGDGQPHRRGPQSPRGAARSATKAEIAAITAAGPSARGVGRRSA
ncbi:hypothetical protein [Nonomuraea recticatena]|uniref:hypothetical protein n=1 Tax=Nonomuraea recticatena TaxID=46178 RepID=UPI0036152F52